MNNTHTYISYLNDSIKDLISRAQEIDKNDKNEFGILIGYYNSISSLLNNAEAFDILESLDKEIQDFVPEELLNQSEK